MSSEDLCGIHCDRAVTCGVVAEACSADCPARGRDLTGMRDDYLGQLALCLEGASCSAISQRTAFGACHEFVVGSLPVTPPLRRFCFEGSRRAARCDRAGDADQSDCLSRFRYLGENALTAAGSCLAASCDEVPRCMQQYLAPALL
jgi:hypothetical protein